jgi:BirA family biotin operon repressor/biotin-[acetyl-CoA-carboxylase] ligase
MTMEIFDAEALQRRLATRLIGRVIKYWPELDSTNTMAMRLAAEGAAEGTVVVADAQRSGRGRAGKFWYSPPGVNLYLSVLLYPAIAVQKVGLLTLIGSLAVADAVDAEGGQAQVKWPNDVLLLGKKVAGVLAEVQATAGQVDTLVLGIGVNLNVSQEILDRALGEAAWGAIALKEALGRQVDRGVFAATLLGNLDRRYEQFLTEGERDIIAEWKARSFLGQRVLVMAQEGSIEGVAADLDESGALIVRLDDGSAVHVFEGGILPLARA